MEKKYENSILQGDCTEVLKELPDESADVAVNVEERDRISRLARDVGLRINVSAIRGHKQALRVVRMLQLIRARIK